MLSSVSAYDSCSPLGSLRNLFLLIPYHSYHSLLAINDCLQTMNPSKMSFPRFWRWRTDKSSDYKSLDTGDLETDEKSGSTRALLRRSNSTSSLSSTSASNKHDEEYHGRSSPRPFSSAKAYIIIAANVLLFLTSASLFIVPYVRSSQLNHAYRQVSTWCKNSTYLLPLSQLQRN